jgi:hypothetical protein
MNEVTSEPDMVEVTAAEMFAMVEQLTDSDWFDSSHEYKSAPDWEAHVGHGWLSDRSDVMVTGALAPDGHDPSWKTVDKLVWLMPLDGSAAGIVIVAGGGQSIDPLILLLDPQAMVERLET